MRLYEFAGTKFTDDLANLLKVMQGNANSKQARSTVTWPALNHLLMTYGHGEVNKDMLEKVKSQVDPGGLLIQDITDSGVVLKTEVATPEPATMPSSKPAPRSIDQMASRAAAQALK